MIDPTECVIGERPFTVRRRVRWGECDPAGVVYTGHFTDYLISAVTLFHEHLFGESGASYGRRQSIQMPCKAMSLAFGRALWPADVFDMVVGVAAIRTRSYDIDVKAALSDGTPVFEGRVSPVCLAVSERRAIPIPDDLRRRLLGSVPDGGAA